MNIKMVEKLLVGSEKYLSAGVHIGTRFKTKCMAKFTYKVNPAGLAILDIQKIDARLRIAAKFLARYKPEKILVVGRRENSWKPIKQFAKLTGVKYFVGRYPAGIITNIQLEDFIEPKVMLIADPWLDKNAIKDAVSIGIPIVGLCDSNNSIRNIDLVVPCNNKGAKALALIFWILANELLHERGELPKKKTIDVPPEEFEE